MKGYLLFLRANWRGFLLLWLFFTVGLGIVTWPTVAPAGAGAMCEHQNECGDPRRFVCIADCETCKVGHCVRLWVLP